MLIIIHFIDIIILYNTIDQLSATTGLRDNPIWPLFFKIRLKDFNFDATSP